MVMDLKRPVLFYELNTGICCHTNRQPNASFSLNVCLNFKSLNINVHIKHGFQKV